MFDWINTWELIFGRTVELKDIKITQFQISLRRNARRAVFSVWNGVCKSKTSVNFTPFPQLKNEILAGTKLSFFVFVFESLLFNYVGPHSSVSTAARYEMGDPGIASRWGG
jgi:hypothetical protein